MQSNSRLAGIDISRLIGAFAIVWIHGSMIPGSQNIARFAIPLFTIISTFFSAKAAIQGKSSIKEYFLKRSLNLAKIFIFWTIFYLSYDYLFYLGGIIKKPHYSLSLIVRGGHYHLWFFPFILFAGLLSFIGARFANKLKILKSDFLKIALIILSLGIVLWMDVVVDFKPNLSKYAGILMWIDAFPSAVIGFFLALCNFNKLNFEKKLNSYSLIISVFLIITLALNSSLIHAVSLLAGASIFLFFLSSRIPSFNFYSVSVADLAICIYLLHPAVLDVLKIFIGFGSFSPIYSIKIVLLALIISVILYIIFFRGALKYLLK
jgi:hypothetical protein